MDIRLKTAWVSALVTLLVFILKLFAFQLTQSKALMSDALETVVNVIAAFFALLIIRFAIQPPDKEHPYGHGKAEYFSAAFEGGLIFFAGLLVIFESSKNLLSPQKLQHFEWGFLFSILATAINLALGIYLQRTGKKYYSKSLIASGQHLLSDVWTTSAALLGLLLVWVTDFYILDALVALCLGLYLIYSGAQLLKDSFHGLVDAADTEVLEKLVQAFNSVCDKNVGDGVIDIHHLRAIRSGGFHHVDAHIIVPEFWTVAQTHDHIRLFEDSVVESYDFDGEIAFHVDPCDKKFCRQCVLVDCPVRQENFIMRPKFSLETITQNPMHHQAESI